MYNECFSHMSKTLQKDSNGAGSHNAQMVLTKMNAYLNIPAYSLISPSNIKSENKINN